MKLIIQILFFSIIVSGQYFAQQDTVYFDFQTGNYIVKYIDKIPYAQKSDGTLRKLNYDSEIYNDEEYLEIDSLVVLEFVPATKINPTISAQIQKSTEHNYFTYNYLIENSESSEQNLNYFLLLFDSDSIKSLNGPNTWGNQRRKIIMNGNLVNSNIWSWSGDQGLAPGWTNNGFFVNAKGLPGISKSYFRGITETFGYPGIIPDSKIAKQLASLRVFPANHVMKETLAPKRIPINFIAQEFIDSVINYNNQSFDLEWIENQETRDKYNNYFNNAKNYLLQNNNSAAKSELQTVLNECNADSSSVLTSEAYALLYFNTEYLIGQIPDSQPGLPIKLQDSQGNLLQGGSLQYYDGSWMDAVNNGDGTFNVITERITVSIRMTYEGGNQQFNNVPVGPDTVTFQTVNSTVKLLNSQNELLPEGLVQFYAGSWREFGTLVNGEASKELLPRQYSFRMTYGGANNDKQQNIGDDPVVVFQTVNSTVQLLNSQGNLIQEEGIVQYYAGSWRTFGTTTSGTVSNELLPKSYSFRMTHEGVNNDKQQNIGVDGTVSFSTVLCVVQVKDAQNQPVNGAEVKYYSGSWRDIGLTANGEVNKELLPKNLTFRVIHNGVVQNKQQDIGTNNIVEFVVE